MILVDAGPLIALLDRADAHHEACVETWRALREPMLTTWPCVTEACHLLGVWEAHDALLTMLKLHKPKVVRTDDATDIERMRVLVAKYRDRPMDLADASLVMVAEREGIRRVFSIDRQDFSIYRVGRRGRFTILP